MTFLDFIALTLAASGAVQVWFRGSLFATPRAYVQARTDWPVDDTTEDPESSRILPEPDRPSLGIRIADRVLPEFVCQILSCPFCLSHHTPYLVAALCLFPSLFATEAWAVFLWKLPLYSLAATRLGNLINAAAPASTQYDEPFDV